MIGKPWVSADIHGGHSNLCSGCSTWDDISKCRPFKTVEQHDQTILDNINEVVMPDDTFYILGDFTVGSNQGPLKLKKREAYIHYRNMINCKHVIYIRGNHSLERKQLVELGIFDEVHDYYEMTYKKHKIVMFHYAMRVWNNHHHNSLHLYAHSHGSLPGIGRSMDVGVDCNNFKPFSLDEIVERLSKIPLHTVDHHKESTT